MTNLEEYKLIEVAISNLYSKIHKLDIKNLKISDYNKEYLKKYISNYNFYMSLYKQLLHKSIIKLKKPISQSIFVDYGGGCGMLSYIAKEIGFKSVIYNDIYQISVNDTKIISREIDIVIEDYICGDVYEFVNELNIKNIKPDLICSFDVLEHIYNLEKWFQTIRKIKGKFSLLFMTSANSRNPYLVNRLKKLQIKAEYVGSNRTVGWKESDMNSPFREVRINIIKNKFPELENIEIKDLSKRTRGLRKEDIEEVVQNYKSSGLIDYQIKHATNTCDPYTGNWTENLIDLNHLKNFLEKINFKVEITNSFYGYSNNKIFNLPKYILNLIIKLLGTKNLFFSPTYTLEINKV